MRCWLHIRSDDVGMLVHTWRIGGGEGVKLNIVFVGYLFVLLKFLFECIWFTHPSSDFLHGYSRVVVAVICSVQSLLFWRWDGTALAVCHCTVDLVFRNMHSIH